MGEICQTAGPNWHQIWHTYADSSGNEHGLKNNYPLETPGGILRGLCGKKTQAWEMWPTAGLIGTNFGALMQMHLERVVGQKKLAGGLGLGCGGGGGWGVQKFKSQKKHM